MRGKEMRMDSSTSFMLLRKSLDAKQDRNSSHNLLKTEPGKERRQDTVYHMTKK